MNTLQLVDNVATFVLRPGERSTFQVSFDAGYAHEVHISADDVPIAKIRSRASERTATLENRTQRNKTMKVEDLYQDGSTESCGIFCTSFVWKRGRTQLQVETNTSAQIGFEDADDNDFNDAVVTISVAQ